MKTFPYTCMRLEYVLCTYIHGLDLWRISFSAKIFQFHGSYGIFGKIGRKLWSKRVLDFESFLWTNCSCPTWVPRFFLGMMDVDSLGFGGGSWKGGWSENRRWWWWWWNSGNNIWKIQDRWWCMMMKKIGINHLPVYCKHLQIHYVYFFCVFFWLP